MLLKHLLLYLVMALVTPAMATNNVTAHERTPSGQAETHLTSLIHDSSEHFTAVESANLDGLLKRIGNSRLVLLGESTHGTEEFYRMRARITRELITRKGFNIIAVEANWPDATVINHRTGGYGRKPVLSHEPFAGFASWLWSNRAMDSFYQWLEAYNRQAHPTEKTVQFYGLDLYNMYGSIEAVLNYLRSIDPHMYEIAANHYACLYPWASDPSTYSTFMEKRNNTGCGPAIDAVLRNLNQQRKSYEQINAVDYFHAMQNARLIRNGEYFYRVKYRDANNTWNFRDNSMFETLLGILNHHGNQSRVIIWAHNSHLGDARATEMSEHNEINLGQRVREYFGSRAYLVGFGTHHGTVTAATEWGAPAKIMQLNPARKGSYEQLFHNVKADNFLLPLRYPLQAATREQLLPGRLQRGIGVAYYPDPESEKKYHYFRVSLPYQFDEYIWFDETRAVTAD